MKKLIVITVFIVCSVNLAFTQATQISGSSLYHLNGNIGIGTTTPSHLLTIRKDVGNGVGAGILLLNNQYSKNEGAETEVVFGSLLAESGKPLRYFKIHNVGSGFGVPDRLSFGSSDLVNDTYRDWMTIKNNGNIGIGTTNPKYLLSVKGKIGAGEIVVEDVTAWADFVFNSDYRLMPLAEVESFIQENNHLPDVPSETEVKEKGINVAEMNAKLLQKIEELTLYVIEQNKRIEELEKQVKK